MPVYKGNRDRRSTKPLWPAPAPGAFKYVVAACLQHIFLGQCSLLVFKLCSNTMNIIDRIPLLGLILLALWLGVAPVTAEPHLLEKFSMLFQGTLIKPIDVFDLLLHATPLGLLAIRLVRMVRQRQAKSAIVQTEKDADLQ